MANTQRIEDLIGREAYQKLSTILDLFDQIKVVAKDLKDNHQIDISKRPIDHLIKDN